VLNYFNGNGQGDDFPTSRGASSVNELERQEAKLVSAFDTMNADVIGLMEIENDGFATDSAIYSLVNALNTRQAEGNEYTYVVPTTNQNQIGDDAIAVGIIYRSSKTTPLNAAQILDSANSPLDSNDQPLFIDDLNRPALAQSFTDNASGEVFTLVVNHLKSKGPRNCDDFNDCDQGDGQGAYNQARTKATQAMTQWLSTHPTGVETNNVIIMGDLNAYSKEDPITTLIDAGYQSLKTDGSYSFVFRGESGNLDHALVSSEMIKNVTLAQEWHINTDEPRALDYNIENKTDAQIDTFFAPTPYRSSDHDPVLIDLIFDTNEPPQASIQVYRFWFWWLFVSDSTDVDGEITAQTWNIGNLTIKKPWAFVTTHYLNQNHIKEITLTVTDNERAKTELTQEFR
jgi:predicted extracellular nuclease